MSQRVFVSYAWDDRERVSEAIAAVSREVDRALDTSDIKEPILDSGTGENIRQEIQRRVASAELFVLIWTEQAAESAWVQYEAGMADALNKQIVVVASGAAPELPAQLADKRVVTMARRYTGNMNGEQYIGNTNKKEVHDLDNEDAAANGCQIDEIIRAGNDKPFTSLAAAHSAGYDNCAKCLTGSRR